MRLLGSFHVDDPAYPVLRAVVSYEGITTAAGLAAGTTVVDAGLAAEPSYQDLEVKILDGPAAGQVRPIQAHVGNTLTVTAGFTNPAGAAQQIVAAIGFVIRSVVGSASLVGKPNVQEVIIYPVAEDLGTTEVADDGTAAAFMPAVAHQTLANAEGAPGVAWTEDVDFEQEGTVTIISIYAEFEWQTQFVDNAGGGTNSISKIQISRDGGTTWVDLTDNFTNPAVAMTNRIRAGVGVWIPTIVAGVDQLAFRLVHWTDDGGATDASEAQIRSNSYVRVTYRKT